MSKVTTFCCYNLGNIPEALRLLAHQIELKQVSAVRCVVILEPEEGTLPTMDYKAFGEDFSRAHAAGLCFAAAHEIVCSHSD